jgi:hypothetical protein
VWVDNGSTFWPPEGWHGLDPGDWPFTAEAQARRRGWASRGSSDFCPDHAEQAKVTFTAEAG